MGVDSQGVLIHERLGVLTP